MIYIRVEMWPGGDKNHPRAHVLGEATIANTGGSKTAGDYRYELRGKKGAPMGGGTISGFPRQRLMAWDLILWVLTASRGHRTTSLG